MSSETNGLYHGNENDSQYRGGPIGSAVPILDNGSGGYRGEASGQYHAVDASAPYRESITNLSRRSPSPVKTIIMRSNK